MEIKTRKLKQHLFSWYRNNKRTFSWRNTNDPWKIFLIEIISQQTQINRADDYYKKFIKEFPTPESMAKSSLKKVNSKDLNQAFMDFGSMVCSSLSPSCDICPLENECSKYFSKTKKSYQKFEGSNREIRGKILKLLLNEDQISKEELINKLGEEEEKLNKALHGLQKDNLLIIKKNNIIEINSK